MPDIADLLPKETATVQAIYDWHEKRDRAPRKGTGRKINGSSIGKPCERYLWYRFRYCNTVIPPKGRMLRLFKTGHLEEPRFLEELAGIGCEVMSVDPETDRQFAFHALGGHFVNYADGVALGLPEAPKTWHLLEFKTMGGTEDQKSKDFEKVKKDGVEQAKPEHYGQVMSGMGLAHLTRAMYLCKKKATDEIHSERVRYVAAAFTRIMDKAERIIRSPQPPERYASRPDSYDCKFCDASDLCWGTGQVAVPVARKDCRMCCHATPEIDKEETWARWSCARKKVDLSVEAQHEGCPDFLLIPGLVNFATVEDAGDTWIEFKNNDDGAVWRHGAGGDGTWTMEELMRTPGPLVGAREVESVKEAFKGTVADVSSEFFPAKVLENPLVQEVIMEVDFFGDNFGQGSSNLVDQYPPEESELVWDGSSEYPLIDEEIGNALGDCKVGAPFPDPTNTFENDTHAAYEFGGRILLVIYKADNYAAIWKGKE